MNILANAIDALEETNVNRTYQESKQKPSQITIRTSIINSEWIKISISDNGMGMSEAVYKRIFDPFFTTKSVGKGTGMGLPISYQIVTEKHGGKLDCFSTAGKGTEFIIQIPVRQQSRAVA
jgi:signal transduction histidine kinase